MGKILLSMATYFLILACQEPQRDCKAFKEGTFTFTAVIDGKEKTTLFTRQDSKEIDVFESKTDTSSVRWINECEYVLKKQNPRTRLEKKSIHIKILSTTDNSYTFEYGVLGDKNRFRGTAIRKK